MGATRRSFLESSMGAFVTAALPGRAGSQPRDPRRPNILYIHSHDSGRYFRPYGHNVPTPALDRLAKGGMLFRQMYSAAPGCSPSRAALLTGQCPHRSGMMGLAHLGWRLNDYQQVIIHTLRQAGYHSTLAGLQHIAADPKWIGYDELLPHASDKAADVAPVASRCLKSAQQEPFFLDVGFFETHREYPLPVDDAAYIQPPSPIPDTPETRLDMAGYHASARDLDRGVATVLSALEDAGLADNTLVISTTDHGIAFPDMKCHLRDSGVGVSMILRGPGIRPGSVCDALLSHVDIFPTVCDMLSIEKPVWLEGKSFLPVLRGAAEQGHDQIFSENTYHAAYQPERSIRTTRWKYIRHFDGRSEPNLSNCDDSPSKTYWIKADWTHNEFIPSEELFDLTFDPAERNNLVSDPHHAAVLGEMRTKLEDWMHRTNDPLLRGPVPLPAGGHTLSPDAVSPRGLDRYAPKGPRE